MFHSTMYNLDRDFIELKEAKSSFKDGNDCPNFLRALLFW